MTEKLTPFPSLLLFIFPIFLRKVLCEEVNCHEISPPPDKIVVLFRFTVVLQAMGVLSCSTEVTLRPWIRTHSKYSQCYVLIPARNIARYCSGDDADWKLCPRTSKIVLGLVVPQVVNDMSFTWRRQPQRAMTGCALETGQRGQTVSKALYLLLSQTLALGNPLRHSN